MRSNAVLTYMYTCIHVCIRMFTISQSTLTYMHVHTCIYTHHSVVSVERQYNALIVSTYKESRNNKPMYGYMLPNLSPSPNLYKVQSVYNNNVASYMRN